MALIELSRQEIWTILCWIGDGDLTSYNLEEASILRKLRCALKEEDARLQAKADAVRAKRDATRNQNAEHDRLATS